MKFKVGDRARINLPGTKNHGKECTILEGPVFAGLRTNGQFEAFGYAYTVRVDGVGAIGPGGCQIGYRASELEPLTRPGLSAEDEKFVKDLQDALFSKLPDFNPKPRQGEIVQAGDV